MEVFPSEGGRLGSPGIKELPGMILRAPSARMAISLGVLVAVPIILIVGLVKPFFNHFFPADPTAKAIRHGIQFIVLGGALYVGVRMVRAIGASVYHAALTRILAGLVVMELLPFVVHDFFVKPLCGTFVADPTLLEAAAHAIMIPLVLTAYVVLFSRYEKRKIEELSPARGNGAVGVAFAVGISIPALTVGVLALSGHYSVVAVNQVSILGFALVSLGYFGIQEELLFRGVIHRICQEKLGTHAAVIVSAVAFSAAHLSNEHVNATAIFSATLGGVLLAVLFSLTGRLWITIAFHVGWNWSQVFFGSTVSGVDEFGAFLQGHLTGPDWLAGGPFGIENSYVLLSALLLLTVLLYRRLVQRGRVVAPYWRVTGQGALEPRRA